MRMKVLAAACGVVVLLSSAAGVSATNPNYGSGTWNPVERWLQGCNDQESTPANCVTDTPTGHGACTWGDEDDITDAAYGKLTAGQVSIDTICLVTDPCSDFACPHMIVYQVVGAGLKVTLTDNRGNTYLVPAAVKTKQGQTVQDCFADPLWPQSDPSALPTIPGTNGGYGLLTTYTLTVTASKTTQFFGGFEIAQNDADGRFGYFHELNTVPCQWR